MRINYLLRFLAISVLLAITLNTVSAQDDAKKDRYPVESFGIGFMVSTFNLNTPAIGGQITYALDPSIHFGSQVAFMYRSENTNDRIPSATYLYVAPYFKYLFEGVKNFRPFGKFSFVFSSLPLQKTNPISGAIEIQTESNTNLELSVGAEWFPYKSIGVFGGFQLVEYQLDRSVVVAGIGTSFLGVEWFL